MGKPSGARKGCTYSLIRLLTIARTIKAFYRSYKRCFSVTSKSDEDKLTHSNGKTTRMLQENFTSNEQFEAHYIDLISMLSLMRVQIRDIDQVSDSFARSQYLSF